MALNGGTVQIKPPQCEDKARLMEEYGLAADEYSRTVNMLRQSMGILPKAEYDQIRNFIEVARLRSETARLALDRHIRQHGC